METAVILGSTSPRRRQILSYFSLPFEVASPPFDESTLPFQGDPERYVRNLAQAKAESLVPEHPDRLILSGDTIVYKEGKIYPKPANEDEAFAYLSELCGTWHTVYTALCALKGSKCAVEIELTRVEFMPLTADQIRRYQHAVVTSDKAGGYMIQDHGSLIVRSIAGCPYNVVGMPVQSMRTVLHHHGIDLWEYLQ